MNSKTLLGIVVAALLLLCVYVYLPRSRRPVRENLPERFPVRGTVSYNGEPPVGAYVKLHPLPLQAKDPSAILPRGRVDETGSFTISSYESDDGAPKGEYAVTLVWTGFPSPHVRPGPDRWRGRFDTPAKPYTTITVEDGPVEIPAIKLEGPKINIEDSMKANPSGPPGPRDR